MTADDKGQIDPAVVAALYVEHAEELKRFLIGVLRDHQLASDVLQAAFVKLSEKGHETKAGSRKAWLFRVAYHEAMAIRRREKVGDKVHERMSWTSEEETGAADQLLIRREAVESVREALRNLSPEQQQVVRMRVYEEKKFVEIAEELGIPLGTALGRMRTALQKLRASLDHKDE